MTSAQVPTPIATIYRTACYLRHVLSSDGSRGVPVSLLEMSMLIHSNAPDTLRAWETFQKYGHIEDVGRPPPGTPPNQVFIWTHPQRIEVPKTATAAADLVDPDGVELLRVALQKGISIFHLTRPIYAGNVRMEDENLLKRFSAAPKHFAPKGTKRGSPVTPFSPPRSNPPPCTTQAHQARKPERVWPTGHEPIDPTAQAMLLALTDLEGSFKDGHIPSEVYFFVIGWTHRDGFRSGASYALIQLQGTGFVRKNPDGSFSVTETGHIATGAESTGSIEYPRTLGAHQTFANLPSLYKEGIRVFGEHHLHRPKKEEEEPQQTMPKTPTKNKPISDPLKARILEDTKVAIRVLGKKSLTTAELNKITLRYDAGGLNGHLQSFVRSLWNSMPQLFSRPNGRDAYSPRWDRLVPTTEKTKYPADLSIPALTEEVARALFDLEEPSVTLPPLTVKEVMPLPPAENTPEEQADNTAMVLEPSPKEKDVKPKNVSHGMLRVLKDLRTALPIYGDGIIPVSVVKAVIDRYPTWSDKTSPSVKLTNLEKAGIFLRVRDESGTLTGVKDLFQGEVTLRPKIHDPAIDAVPPLDEDSALQLVINLTSGESFSAGTTEDNNLADPPPTPEVGAAPSGDEPVDATNPVAPPPEVDAGTDPDSTTLLTDDDEELLDPIPDQVTEKAPTSPKPDKSLSPAIKALLELKTSKEGRRSQLNDEVGQLTGELAQANTERERILTEMARLQEALTRKDQEISDLEHEKSHREGALEKIGDEIASYTDAIKILET